MLSPTLAKATAVGGLAELLFGFDTAVISGTTTGLTRAYHLTPGGLGLTVSIALWAPLQALYSPGFQATASAGATASESWRVVPGRRVRLPAGMELACVGVLPVRGGAGDWRIVRDRPDVPSSKSRPQNGGAAWWAFSNLMSSSEFW
jgi:hypothetical protein